MGGKILSEEETRRILSQEFEHSYLGTVSVRFYLISLLLLLWQEGEGFSSKRPFGNSNWYDDLREPIDRVLGGFNVEDYDDIVEELILSL